MDEYAMREDGRGYGKQVMTSLHCPRFEKCSAPICPVDTDWRLRSFKSGEPICAFLLEASRNRSIVPEYVTATEEVRQAVQRAYPEVIFRWRTIGKRLQRASKCGPKLGRRFGATLVKKEE